VLQAEHHSLLREARLHRSRHRRPPLGRQRKRPLDHAAVVAHCGWPGKLSTVPSDQGPERLQFGNRSAERLLRVTATCRQQGRPLLDLLVVAGTTALQRTAVPSLLSTRLG
jgi:hypothetical protein